MVTFVVSRGASSYAAPPIAVAAPEGPVLPPSPEQEKRLAELAQKVEAAEAYAAAVEEYTTSELAEERTKRRALQRRIDSLEALEDDMATTLRRAANGPPPVSSARTPLRLSGFVQADFGVRQSSAD